MKKRKSRVLVLLMMLTMLVLSAGTAQAASAKWTKAAKAYKTFLAKNESKYKVRVGDFKRKNTESTKKSAQFMLVDLNKDGVPELVTYYNILKLPTPVGVVVP